MLHSRTASICSAITAISLSMPLIAEPVPRSDLNTKLPERAIARLGSPHFRHGGPITALAISNDGKYTASASQDHTLRIWETDTGKLLRSIRCELYYPTGVAFSPDGKHLAADLDGENITLLEWGSDKPPRQLKAAAARAVVWSPNGVHIGCALVGDDSVNIFAVESGKLLHKIKGGLRVALAPDGKTFAVGYIGGEIKIHDLDSAKPLKTLNGSASDAVGDLRYSRDGAAIVAAYPAGRVDVWEVERKQRIHSFKAHGPALFVPDDKSLAAIVDQRITLFPRTKGEAAQTVVEAKPESPFAFTPDGNRIVVAGLGHRLRVWNLTMAKEMLFGDGHTGEVTGLAFGPKGENLLSSGTDGLRLWNPREMKELAGGRRSLAVEAMALSPDARRIVTVSPSSIHVWKPVDLAAALPYPQRPSDQLNTTMARLPFLAFTPDGERFAFPDGEKTLGIADPTRGVTLAGLELGAEPLAATFGPNGRSVAVITRDGLLSHWSVSQRGGAPPKNDVILWKKRVQRNPRAAVAFAPNGLLIAGSSAGRVVLLECATGRQWYGFDRQLGDGDVQAIAFSPDSRIIAVGHGGPEGIVRLWEVLTGKEIVVFCGHAGGVNAVTFSPDGTRIASAGADSSILLWSLTYRAPDEAANPTLDEAWNALDSENTHTAYRAMSKLVNDGAKSIAHIDTGLKDAVNNQLKIRKLIKQLDDDDFRIRKNARTSLEKEGLRAIPALHEALRQKRPQESERLLQHILEGLEARGLRASESGLYGESLRCVRAIHVLERIGGMEAIRVLETLVDSKEDSRIANEARAAIDRLRK